MTDLNALIERLEKASGPDRELDLAIHLAIEPEGDIAGLMRFRRGFDGKPGIAWDIHHGGSVCFEKFNESNQCFYNGGYPLPKYTSSIDAAMKLVPEKHTWHIDSSERVEENPDGWYWASVRWPSAFDFRFERATAPHPAIALCIAALKALTRTATEQAPS